MFSSILFFVYFYCLKTGIMKLFNYIKVLVWGIIFMMPYISLAQGAGSKYEGMYSKQQASAKVSAVIVKTYKAVLGTDLKFGNVNVSNSPTEVEVTPDDTRLVSGKINLGDNSYSPARYYLSGGNDVSCSIILPDKPVVLTNAGHSKTITVTDWNARLYSDNAGAEQSLIMGATLKVGHNNKIPAGVYQGSYNVTFLYN